MAGGPCYRVATVEPVLAATQATSLCSLQWMRQLGPLQAGKLFSRHLTGSTAQWHLFLFPRVSPSFRALVDGAVVVDERCHARKPHSRLQPQTPNLKPNSTRTPLPLLGNNATLEIIDGVMVIPIIVLITG